MSGIEIMKMGLIGLSSMGVKNVCSLAGAGFASKGHDINPDALRKVGQTGGLVANSAADMARIVDVLAVVVVNAAQTEAMLFGKAGVESSTKPDAGILSFATMSPHSTQHLACRAEQWACSTSMRGSAAAPMRRKES